VTKEGTPAGLMSLQHEADIQVTVEALQWSLKKSRYQDITNVGGEVLNSPQLDVLRIKEEMTHASA
jgi:hypothetical protein